MNARKADKPFGIPTVISNKMNEMGTLVELKDIVQTYDNGEMDIQNRRGQGVPCAWK